ncbi:serine hydrolase domain-containing protein [Arenicella xantha]|uniref:CubicO group peptidase (Beta-lactamase class C family) n=1 Tax=Arenicella xantha TaxID=644221 RepID=A0A395JHT0_9GAMM|nr:serine hydrolase [Arenicella xantha]RBP49700.1 CubicO group peptidase (beta-lactamase class C family) [Arenicella xantha]
MMKILVRSLLGIVALIVVGLITLVATGNGYIITSLQRTYLVGNVTANINDYTEFTTREIKAASPSPLDNHSDYNTKALPTAFIEELIEYDSVGFLVLKDGKVLHESYYNDYHDRSKTNSFSMAKTVTTLLLGIAIEEGHVTGLDQPITDFLPEFNDDPLGSKATIGQLSAMNSGYDWDEQYYSPFSPTVELLYGDDIRRFVLERKFTSEPGTFWYYSSASTELMGIFLERALKQAGAADNLSEYLSQKLWQPLQMNDDALWHLDDNGMELVFCCLSTNLRNYAKLGQLMLNQGDWQGQQLVNAAFIQNMTKPGLVEHYGLSTWLGLNQNPANYWFSGHLGQHIIVVPEHNMVIVRLGERSKPGSDHITDTVPNYVQAALTLIQ